MYDAEILPVMVVTPPAPTDTATLAWAVKFPEMNNKIVPPLLTSAGAEDPIPPIKAPVTLHVRLILLKFIPYVLAAELP